MFVIPFFGPSKQWQYGNGFVIIEGSQRLQLADKTEIFAERVSNCAAGRRKTMINREDMMELTRRMTPSRTSFTRIAGCYVDGDGAFDGSFNVHFLKLSGGEKAKHLEIAKAIPFSETNRQLKAYRIPEEKQGPGSMWQMLMAMRACGLKNDALMDTFYDVVMEHDPSSEAYGVLVFHDRYDVPRKAADKERLWESEDVFEYFVCAICPLTGEYEPGLPACGFLFPAFSDRCGDLDRIYVYQSDPANPGADIMLQILGISE